MMMTMMVIIIIIIIIITISIRNWFRFDPFLPLNVPMLITIVYFQIIYNFGIYQ